MQTAKSSWITRFRRKRIQNVQKRRNNLSAKRPLGIQEAEVSQLTTIGFKAKE